MTINIDEILFSNNENKNLNQCSDILFNLGTEQDNENIPVEVSYFFLKKDKKLDDENIIYSDSPLIEVGYCKDTDMINVCFFEGNIKKYFWTKTNEVDFRASFTEYWNIENVRKHHKAINEKWIIEKNTTKELKKKKNKVKLNEIKEKKNNK